MNKVTIGEDGLRCEPMNYGPVWFYEEPRGLSIYLDKVGRLGAIPVTHLEKYLDRIHARRRNKNRGAR